MGPKNPFQLRFLGLTAGQLKMNASTAESRINVTKCRTDRAAMDVKTVNTLGEWSVGLPAAGPDQEISFTPQSRRCGETCRAVFVSGQTQ
jgi:hypothetical protein